MRTMNPPLVGIAVDAYSTGNFLPDAFARLGVRLVHVQSTPELMPSMLAPDLSKYIDNVAYGTDESVMAKLRGYDPLCVVAGQEPGVPLADLLSEQLGLATNGTALSPARRDKYQMIEAVRAAGLRAARQFKSASAAELTGWAQDNDVFPAVVKPLSSASTDGVYICSNAAEVLAAAERVLASHDIFDIPNREALIQSYLEGVEYIVDTVSCEGERYVCGVWQYEKSLLPSGKKIYDKDILLAPDAAGVSELISYVDAVLSALNIRWGAAHAEVIMTPEGPTLVEIGARLNGNMNPGFHDVCLGHNQADLVALAYARPQEFRRNFSGRVYHKLQDAIVYNTQTSLDGTIASIDQPVVDEISALESVQLLSVKLKPGSRIRPTVDLLTSPLRVFMTARNLDQIMADYASIRRLRERVYVLQ